MSTDLEEDISVLNINDLDEDQDGPSAFPFDSQGLNRSRPLHVLGHRHDLPDLRVDQGNQPSISRPEELLKELQTLRDLNRTLQQERSSSEQSRGTAQKECIHLRDKVSCLFRENCSLKEQSAKLTIDNRGLQKQVDSLKQSNARLRERLQQFSQQLRSFVKNKDGVVPSPPSSMSSQHMEQVKMMLDAIGNLPKSNDDSKESSLSNEKRDIPRILDRGPGKEVVTLELDHENLEQISHKLLEHLQQEKRELEQQYSQIVEVQKFSGHCLSTDVLQNSLDVCPIKEKEMLGLLESCRSSTKLLKEEVLIQNQLITTVIHQMALINTLKKRLPELQSEFTSPAQVPASVDLGHGRLTNTRTSTKPVRQEPSSYSECNRSKNDNVCGDSNVESWMQKYGHNIPEWGVPDNSRNICPETTGCASLGIEEDRLCPMCQAVFPKAFPVPEFEAHVMDHFRCEEFEIVTKDLDYC